MEDTETFYEGWERFKNLLALCLNHNLQDWVVAKKLYNWVTYGMQSMLNTAAGGNLLTTKDTDEWITLFNGLAMNGYQRPPAKSNKSVEYTSQTYIQSTQTSHLRHMLKH